MSRDSEKDDSSYKSRNDSCNSKGRAEVAEKEDTAKTDALKKSLREQAERTFQARRNDPLKQSRTDFGLAIHYKNNGDYELAMKHIEDAHRRRLMHLGPHHHLVAATLEIMGDIDMQWKNFHQAEMHYERALGIVEEEIDCDANTETDLSLALVQKATDGIYTASHIRRRARAKLKKLQRRNPADESSISSSVTDCSANTSLVSRESHNDRPNSVCSISSSLTSYDTFISESAQFEMRRQDFMHLDTHMPVVSAIRTWKTTAPKNDLPIVQGQIKQLANYHQVNMTTVPSYDSDDDILFLPHTQQQHLDSESSSRTRSLPIGGRVKHTQHRQCNSYIPPSIAENESSDSDIQFNPQTLSSDTTSSPSSDNVSDSRKKRERQRKFALWSQKE